MDSKAKKKQSRVIYKFEGITLKKDNTTRYITIAVEFEKRPPFERRFIWGVSIADSESHIYELGKQIALDRARSKRPSVEKKGLRGYYHISISLLERCPELYHDIPESLLNNIVENIEDIIWPKTL